MTSILDTSLDSLENWESIEPPMESDEHRDQLDLLIACLRWWWRHRSDVYISGNTTIYYHPSRTPEGRFKSESRGPDFYLVFGVDPSPRKSWRVWTEKDKYPDLIIELLSTKTATEDQTTKKEIYETIFKTPEYFLFHPQKLTLTGYRLVAGEYQPLEVTEQGWYWSEQLQLYLGVYNQQLRYFTPEGELVPTDGERAEYEHQQRQLEQQQAEQQLRQARQRAEQAEQEAERLRQQLRELGIEP